MCMVELTAERLKKECGYELVVREDPVQRYLIESIIKDIEPDESIKKDVELFKDPMKLYMDSEIFKTMTNPQFLPNLEKGSNLIREYILANKKVLFITDYDCDGTMAYASICKLVKEFTDYSNYRVVMNKRKHGNGINPPLVESIEDFDSYELIVTADHGVGSTPYLSELLDKNKNLKIVVTDHHVPLHTVREDLKERLIIVDAWLTEHENFCKNLSGATIGSIVMIRAITDFSNNELTWELLKKVSPFLCTSVLSDVMDVSVIFNRLLVTLGIKEMNRSDNDLYTSFKRYVSGGCDITHSTLKFLLIPMINSGNRMHREDLLEEIFKRDTNPDEISSFTVQLYQANKERKAVTNKLVELYLDNNEHYKNKNAVVVKIKTNLGINGIVAGKISGLEQKPTVCFIESGLGDGLLHGSLRTPSGIDLLSILEVLKNEGLVEHFGGHKEACGCSVKEEKYKLFETRFIELSPSSKEDVVEKVDLAISAELLNAELAKKINDLEPYGKGFPELKLYTELFVSSAYFNGRTGFYTSDVDISNPDGARRINMMCFNSGKYDLASIMKQHNLVGIIFSFKNEIYNPEKTPTLMISVPKKVRFDDYYIQKFDNS